MGKKKLLPGEFIATEEEFEPGGNAFEENGSIYANGIGHVVENGKQHLVSIEKVKDVSPARVGDIVLGEVMLVKDNSVSLAIFTEPEGNDRRVLSHSFASLPVRNVSRDYVKNLKDAFRVGDIVRARIASIAPYGIDVRTNEPDLGVIRGFCSKCRQPLHLFGNRLKCLACGDSEARKVAKDYSLK